MPTMPTMNISLPEGMKAFVDAQVEARGFGTSSEYVRDLIRKEQEREALRALLVAGAKTPVVAEPDAAYFSSLHARIQDGAKRKAMAARKSPRR